MTTPFEELIIGRSPEIQATIRTAQIVAATDATVLLCGETGTGKELMAQAVHRASRRVRRPFVALNCAAMPEALVESELFGARRGAYTGAVADQPGKLVAAEGGTVFLDEIGEMPPAVQAKLLRFLETGEVQPVGQAMPQRVDVRIVAATNRDLARRVEEGQFREDLFYRLNVVPIELPPLRRRKADIGCLVAFLLDRACRAYGLAPAVLQPAALAVLERYRWPGNVRELRNTCERLAILRAGQPIAVDDLPPEFLRPAPAGRHARMCLPEGGIVLDELERDLIRDALQMSRGNRSEAARLLGLTRDTLLYRIKKYQAG